MIFNRLNRNSPYRYRLSMMSKLSSNTPKTQTRNFCHDSQVIPPSRIRPFSLAMRKSLSCRTSRQYEYKNPQANLNDSLSTATNLSQNAWFKRHGGRGLM